MEGLGREQRLWSYSAETVSERALLLTMFEDCCALHPAPKGPSEHSSCEGGALHPFCPGQALKAPPPPHSQARSSLCWAGDALTTEHSSKTRNRGSHHCPVGGVPGLQMGEPGNSAGSTGRGTAKLPP